MESREYATIHRRLIFIMIHGHHTGQGSDVKYFHTKNPIEMIYKNYINKPKNTECVTYNSL